MATRRSDVDYLYDYVRNDKECVANDHCKGAITRYIRSDGKVVDDDEELIVYRGHYKRRNTIDPGVDWFSTSTAKKVSEGFMDSDRKCCLFTIHCMPGIHYIDVNKALGNCSYSERGIYKHEKEIILLGGGYFYQDVHKKEEGFKHLGNGRYETWYFPNRVLPSRSRSKSPPPAAAAAPANRVSLPKPVCKEPVTRKELINRAAEDGYNLNMDDDISQFSMYLKSGERLALPHEEQGQGGGGAPPLKRTRGRYTGTRRRRRPARRHTRAAR